jgi:undecaprenyl-diphosphatase
LFQILTGVEPVFGGFRIACRLGAFLALLMMSRKAIHRLHREKRISRIPAKRRRRQPDLNALMELRFLRTAAIPAVLVTVLVSFLNRFVEPLWLLAIIVALCGVILYLPPYFQSGNKNAAMASGLDAMLTGISGGIGGLTGLSGPAGFLTVSSLVQLDRQYAVRMCQLVMLFLLPTLIGLDIASVAALSNSLFSAGWLGLYALAGIAAFGGAYLAILLLRFLAVHRGYSGFAYYCWALALLIFALYLMI